MQPIHYCAQCGHIGLFSLLCDQYGVSPVSARFVSCPNECTHIRTFKLVHYMQDGYILCSLIVTVVSLDGLHV